MKLSSNTNIGSTRRDNQDNYWSARINVNGEEYGVICLCDGMGGLADGALASSSIVKAVREFFKYDNDFSNLSEVVRNASMSIYQGSDPAHPSGTTCTILMCGEGGYSILHIGDSRCYKASKGVVKVLTKDHSAYASIVENNPKVLDKLSEKKIRQLKSSLTRCLGVKSSAVLDYEQGNYQDGDIFLVCSDGFWHFLDERSFFNGDLKDLNSMVENCIRKGETDNITVGVLEV